MNKVVRIQVLISMLAALASVLFLGCAEEDKAVDLVAEADDIVMHHLDDAGKRDRAVLLYDRALNDSKMPKDEILRQNVIAHANFGLGIIRTFDLFELAVGFFTGSVSSQADDEETETINVNQYLPAVEAVLDTSLLPLVGYFRNVITANDTIVSLGGPDFAFVIDPEVGKINLTETEFDNGNTCIVGFNYGGHNDLASVLLALGTTELILTVFKVGLIYNDFIQVVIDIILRGNLSGFQLEDLPNLFNMVSGSGNPLLDPNFGLLNQKSALLLPEIGEYLENGAADFNRGFTLLSEQDGIENPAYNRESFFYDLLTDFCIIDINDNEENSVNSLARDLMLTPPAPERLIGFFTSLTGGLLKGFDEELEDRDTYYNLMPDLKVLLGGLYFKGASIDSLLTGSLDLIDSEFPAINAANLITNPINDMKQAFPSYAKLGGGYFCQDQGDLDENGELPDPKPKSCVDIEEGVFYTHNEPKDADYYHGWPTVKQIDPPNGVRDQFYFFFSDPEMNGLLRRSECAKSQGVVECDNQLSGEYSNGNINKLLSYFVNLVTFMQDFLG